MPYPRNVPCAQTDKNGAIPPVSCPALHTRGRPVCTNGHETARIGIRVSGKAHAIRQRVRKRTRPARIRRAGVRIRTRPLWSRANADVETPGPTSARPEMHTHGGTRMARRDPSSPREARACRPVTCGPIHQGANGNRLAAALRSTLDRRSQTPKVGYTYIS